MPSPRQRSCTPGGNDDAIRLSPRAQSRGLLHRRTKMLELIAKFVSDRGGVSEAEATAWAQDPTELGPNYFLSLNRYLFLAHKPT